MQIVEINKKKQNTCSKEQSAEMYKKLRREYEKLVKVRFEFVDAQGGWLDFTDRQFPDESVKVYKIAHGEVCELPMGLVKRLNNTRKKIRKPNMGEIKEGTRGVPLTYDVISRINCTPIDFLIA